jgi:LmbE family N-acetylglucosaminyl deacetylase
MRHKPAGPVIVLSPHLDDAVLSAFTVLSDASADVVVVNVCDGIPPSGPASDWVRLCGGHDDAAQMRRRHAEDRAALTEVGRSAMGLALLEADERSAEATCEAIVERIRDRVESAAGILAPVGMGSHPDHLATRDAAFRLWTEEPALGLRLYADIPYAIRVGWPPWVSGADPDPHLDPSVPWERALGRLPVPRDRLSAGVRRLDRAQRSWKSRALGCYASQIPALAGGPHRTFADEALSFEVIWSVSPAPPEGERRAAP